jgi:hypothetical protein
MEKLPKEIAWKIITNLFSKTFDYQNHSRINPIYSAQFL